jgi:2-C-methyl-D-erythritol 4-phosphate cytidylyltransferase
MTHSKLLEAALCPDFFAVVPAAGIGARMSAALPKQYISIAGKTLLEHSLAPLLAHPKLKRLLLVLAADDKHWPELGLANHPAIITAIGGVERHHSVNNGLLALQSEAVDEDWVLVHDAVRPCLSGSELNHLLLALASHPCGGILAVPVIDTLKQVDDTRQIQSTVARNSLWQAQTPQMFRYGILRQALAKAQQEKQMVTDEASAVEALSVPAPMIIEGKRTNSKVTTQADLAWVLSYLQQNELEC